MGYLNLSPNGKKIEASYAGWSPLKEPAPKHEEKKNPQLVIIKGIDIPFWDLVWLIVKLSFATIPAALIIFLLLTMIAGIFTQQ